MLKRLSDRGPWFQALFSLLGAGLIAGILSYSVIMLSEWTVVVALIYGVFLLTGGPLVWSKSEIGNTIRMRVIFGMIIPVDVWMLQMR